MSCDLNNKLRTLTPVNYSSFSKLILINQIADSTTTKTTEVWLRDNTKYLTLLQWAIFKYINNVAVADLHSLSRI